MKNKLEDVAEVLAYMISQERVMTVPPVLIPAEGSTAPRKRAKKQPRNMFYTKKDPREAQSISKDSLSTIMDNPEEFPIERPEVEVCEFSGEVEYVVTPEELEGMI